MKKEYSFLPIIVGTDINAYNMAISFHEAYGLKPVLVGRESLHFTALSSITETIELYSDLTDPGRFAEILAEVAGKYREPAKTLLLVGTNDLYVRLIIENAAALKEQFVFNYISEDLMNRFQMKANFYELCKEHGIDTPATFF